MTSRFLDTNILLYSITGNPADAAKRARASAVIDEKDNALSVQVLQEFYVQATRPTRRDAISHEAAAGLVRRWLRFPVQDITVAVMSEALRIKVGHQLSYWDAAIVAAARALGCREIYSEDMSHGRDIEGSVIVNPFL
jgi:predicted nucleic acid-binding protein